MIAESGLLKKRMDSLTERFEISMVATPDPIKRLEQFEKENDRRGMNGSTSG